MARGNTQIYVATQQMAYPSPEDAEYCPLIRVFKSPYQVGDCPVDELLLEPDGLIGWTVRGEDALARATIDETAVVVISESGSDYTIGDLYELRIYQSDVPFEFE